MVLLESEMIELGTVMPDFKLPGAFGEMYSRDRVMGEKGLLIGVTCNHCPYAIAIWDRFIVLAEFGEELGIRTVAINPNIHPDYPEDSPENMQKLVNERGVSFPYLVDETQDVARSYGAQCTPDLYLLDHKSRLVYHGRLDDNWQNPSAVTRQDLKDAIGALGSGEKVSEQQFSSMGCSIKWK